MSDTGLIWQPSLLGGAEPAFDPGFSTLRRTELDATSWVDHAPGWVTGADTLFDRLLTGAAWVGNKRWMYDRVVDDPRLRAEWPDRIGGDLRDAVLAALAERYERPFDNVGILLYRDGRDSVAWHGDRVARTVEEPLVVIVSLGAGRRFLVRPKGGSPSTRFDLRSGDLLVMGGRCQHDWEHTVPKTARATGPRISITIRHS
jgi:alkylated DNA repair dioxygenase AlkB